MIKELIIKRIQHAHVIRCMKTTVNPMYALQLGAIFLAKHAVALVPLIVILVQLVLIALSMPLPAFAWMASSKRMLHHVLLATIPVPHVQMILAPHARPVLLPTIDIYLLHLAYAMTGTMNQILQCALPVILRAKLVREVVQVRATHARHR